MKNEWKVEFEASCSTLILSEYKYLLHRIKMLEFTLIEDGIENGFDTLDIESYLRRLKEAI